MSEPIPAAPVVVLLHALGLSSRSWDGVVDALGDPFDCVAIDLPGYGDAAGSDRLTVEQSALVVAERLRALQPDRWLIAGHSMGGKVAAVVTAWAEAGEQGLIAPDGLVLVDASPPSPEPMSEQRRAGMEDWAEDGPVSPAQAERFVDQNAPHALPALRETAVADVQRAAPTAWLQWLERGSLEDWTDAVGVLRTPAVIVASDPGGDLGPAAQRRLTLPHVPGATVQEVDGAGHFVVLEQPQAVADAIAGLWQRVSGPRALPAAFARLIASDRVSAKTRAVMLARLDGPGDAPRALDDAQRDLLTALLARIIPQRGTDLDLAGRIDSQLAAGNDDGWRFGDLPPDVQAWRAGLDTVAAVAPGLADLPAEEQDAWITRFSDGEAGSDEPGLLDGRRMGLWFEDVRGEGVRVWLSHPAAQAWIRYDGFADGGDGERKQGYLRTRAGEREPWQRDWRTGAAR